MSMSIEESRSPVKLLERGKELLRQGDRLRALSMFERSYEYKHSPECASYLGMLTATERGLVKKGIDLCNFSIESEPGNPVHYLNLGKLLYNVERKAEAVDVVLKAKEIKGGSDEEIEKWLHRVGVRKRPVFPFLTRGNPINKYTGMILRRLGVR